MKLNNLLNRLGMKKIYMLLLAAVLLIIAIIYFVLRTLFYVESPERIFQIYLHDIQDKNFKSALDHVTSADWETWKKNFSESAQDDSAQKALQFYLLDKSSAEWVSTSTLSENAVALRFLIQAPDAEKLLQQAREMAESGQIDMSDPDLVRVGLDPESSLIYYIIDHNDQLKTQTKSSEVIINFKLEGKFIDKAWNLTPTEELHKALNGQVESAIKTVFKKPLVIPKS